MDKNTQQPVLTVEIEPDYWSGGHFYEGKRPHVDQAKVHALPIGTKLYPAPPLPRDVLMAALWEFHREFYPSHDRQNNELGLRIATIADRYAGQVQPDRIAPDVMDALVGNDGGRKPDQVNQQPASAQQARIAELESKWLAERNAYLQERNKCEQLENDAARYRWLRDISVPPHNFYISVPDEFAVVRYAPTEVDAYIDAAMKK